MMVCVPVGDDGSVDPRWGRARRVAVVQIEGGAIVEWRDHEVGWDRLHDEATDGSHHARVATFLREQGIDVVMAHHMGEGMRRTLDRMGIAVRLGVQGPARSVVASLLAGGRN